MKNKKKILMPIMALVLSVILFGYQVPNIKAEESTTVDLTNLTGTTWVLNDVPNSWANTGESLATINIDFVSNGTNYTYFSGTVRMNAQEGFDTYIAYNTNEVYTTPAGWLDASYRTIEITGGADATDPVFINWLQVNGTLTPPGYEVTFITNGGTSVTNLENVEELPTPLPTTTKTNNIFVGWFYDSGFEIQAFSGDTISSNITLYAKFIAESTTVEFTIAPNGEMIDGAMPVKFLPKTETQPSIELIASNLDLITGSLMVIDDYQSTNNYSETLDVSLTFAEYIMFTGSSSEIGLKIGLDGNGFLYHYALIGDGAYITLTFDITLNNVSNYVNITYLLDGESYEVRKQKKDDIPNLPITEPTKYGFTFKGWYLDPEYTTPLSLYDRFEIDSYVYGFFEEKAKITIKFYDGDVVISEATQYESEAILKPSNPVKAGQVFMGWYLDPNFETRLENEDTFTTNTNLYAKFVADSGGAVIPTPDESSTPVNLWPYFVGTFVAGIFIIAFINRKKR